MTSRKSPSDTRADVPAEALPADLVTHDELPPLGAVAALVRRAILIGVLPVFSAVYLWQALTIKVPERALAVSPRSFPVIIGSLMLAVSVALAIAEIRRVLVARAVTARGEQAPAELDDDPERITSWRDAWVVLGSLVAYVATFAALGFFVSTVIFLVCLSTYFAPRRLVRNVVVSVVFSFAIYLLFVNVLNVQLPDGLLAGVI